MRQINAALQEAYTNDHIAANKEPPVAKLVDNPEYASAKLIADNAALPDKGERPDRDPQVRGVAHPRHVPYGAAIATDMWVLPCVRPAVGWGTHPAERPTFKPCC